MYFNRWVVLLASAVIQACAGAVYIFPLYEPDLQKHFGLSQYEAQTIGAVLILGAYFSLPGRLMVHTCSEKHRLGPRVVLWTGAALGALGYSGLYLLVEGAQEVRLWLPLLAAFVAGLSHNMFDVGAMSTNLRNFHGHRTSVTGILQACLGLGPSLFASLYVLLLWPNSTNLLLLLAVLPNGLVLVLSALINTVPPELRRASPKSRTAATTYALTFLVLYALVALLAAHQLIVALLRTRNAVWSELAVTAAIVVVGYLVIAATGGVLARRRRQAVEAAEEAAETLERLEEAESQAAAVAATEPLLPPEERAEHAEQAPPPEGQQPTDIVAGAWVQPPAGEETPFAGQPAGEGTGGAWKGGELQPAAPGKEEGYVPLPERDTAPERDTGPARPGPGPGLRSPARPSSPLVRIPGADTASVTSSVDYHAYHDFGWVQQPNLSLLRTAFKLDFWLLFIIFLIGAGSELAVNNNLSDIAVALATADITPERLHRRQVTLVSLFAVGSCFGRLLFAVLPPLLLLRVGAPRPLHLIGTCLLTAACHLGGAFATAHGWMILALLHGLAFGAYWMLLPAILADVFGARSFAANSSVLSLSPALGCYLLGALLVGKLYDKVAWGQQGPREPYTCTGRQCFAVQFLVMAGMAAAGAVLTVVVYGRTRRLYQAIANKKIVTTVPEEAQELGL